MDYNNPDVLNGLRVLMIELRDEALKQQDFEWAVNLSHVIAGMQAHIDLLTAKETTS